jgi:hypothetical protein
MEEFGGDRQIVAPAFDRLADDRLGFASRIDVRRVDEVDSGVDRPMDDARGILMVGIAHRAEHHRAETERADLDTGRSERAHLHCRIPRQILSSCRP